MRLLALIVDSFSYIVKGVLRPCNWPRSLISGYKVLAQLALKTALSFDARAQKKVSHAEKISHPFEKEHKWRASGMNDSD